MSSRRTSVPTEDVFPRMLYCDSSCTQTLPALFPALPGALLCNATRRLGDGQRVILRQRARGSVRAVRAVWNTRVFQTETRVVADVTHTGHANVLKSKSGGKAASILNIGFLVMAKSESKTYNRDEIH
jgi:hypothetical protein